MAAEQAKDRALNRARADYSAPVRRHGIKRADPRYLSKAWRKFRLTILERDNYRCVKCGADVSAKGAARVDHPTPLSQGGELFDPKCRTLCPSCDNQSHREKGTGASQRDERFMIRGATADGMPRDPNHPWHRG